MIAVCVAGRIAAGWRAHFILAMGAFPFDARKSSPTHEAYASFGLPRVNRKRFPSPTA